MKFDPFKWEAVKANVENKAPQGLLHVMCAKEATLYVTCAGVTAIAGHGKEIRVQIADPFTFKVKTEDGKDCDCYIYAPMNNAQEAIGEVYTNIDRKPDESGTMLEISRALRKFKLEQMHIQKQTRAEFRKLQSVSKVKHPLPPEEEGTEPDPKPAAKPPADPKPQGEKPETKSEPDA